jgi:hypothetical protein
MPEIQLICTDCNQAFPFTERDQEFFKQKGWGEPKRCKPCRIKRKNERFQRGQYETPGNPRYSYR